MRYRLKDDCAADLHGLGYLKFTKGDVTPKDDAEAEALEHLADNCPDVVTRIKTKEA